VPVPEVQSQVAQPSDSQSVAAPGDAAGPDQPEVSPAPAAPPQIGDEPKRKTSEEILAEEKKQTVLGVMPMYGVTNYQYAPALTKGQKFDLMARSYLIFYPYLAAGIQAGISQGFNNFEGYGQGAAGYGKRFGSALLDGFDSGFFSNYFYPVLFKQDPRYFRLGEGSAKHRILYAMVQEFVTKKDSDRTTTFSYSNVLGAVTSGAISNAYYPQEERGFELTMSRTATALAWGSVGNLLNEFWPDVVRHYRKTHQPQDAAVK
jgi:hypothetical protein